MARAEALSAQGKSQLIVAADQRFSHVSRFNSTTSIKRPALRTRVSPIPSIAANSAILVGLFAAIATCTGLGNIE